MALALQARDFEQNLLSEYRRAAQNRAGYQDLVLARELPDERARRVGDERQPLGQFRPGDRLREWDEVYQQFVEQLDVAGLQSRGVLKKQLGDAAGRLGAALGVAMLDDLVEPGDERGGDC